VSQLFFSSLGLKMGQFVKFVLAFALLLACSGCILVPILDSVNRSGITRQQRVDQLPPAVKGFQDALFWGDQQRALAMVPPESQSVVSAIIQKLPEDERVVDAKMLSADYGEDAYDAQVLVRLRSFSPSSLVIVERKQQQSWRFDLGGGWQVVNLKNIDNHKEHGLPR
jgi:hypothetical protein